MIRSVLNDIMSTMCVLPTSGIKLQTPEFKKFKKRYNTPVTTKLNQTKTIYKRKASLFFHIFFPSLLGQDEKGKGQQRPDEELAAREKQKETHNQVGLKEDTDTARDGGGGCRIQNVT